MCANSEMVRASMHDKSMHDKSMHDKSMHDKSMHDKSMHDKEQIGELLGVMHDLRQPVAAIRYILSIVADRPDLPDDVPLRLGQLDAHTRWMDELLHEGPPAMPATAEPRPSGTASIPSPRRAGPRAVRLDRVAAQVADAASAGHSGRLVLESAVAVAVAVDQTALRRTLGNLLDNAFRAAGPTGTVRVRVGVDDEGAVASVDDDGPGFGHVDSGSRRGLFMAVQMAVSAGGRLEIGRSDLGGVRVSLRLPARGEAPVRTMTAT